MHSTSALFVIAVSASAQCYQFSGPALTLQVNITGFVQQNTNTLSNGGYLYNSTFVGNQSLTLGGTTQSAQSTNPSNCVECFVGSLILSYENNLSSFSLSVHANNTPLNTDSWTVQLGGVGNEIPGGVLPAPLAFPPISSWVLPTTFNDQIEVFVNGTPTYYPITTIGPCSSTTGTTGGTGSNAPVITTINTSGAAGTSGIAQNTWTEIHGTNLVPATTNAGGVLWNTAPSFLQGLLPTELGAISVTVDGKPAYVYFYCSAATDPACANDQINVLTPLDSAVGNVQVVVSSNGTSTAPFTATMHTVVPSFLLFSAQGYIAATHTNYTLIGPPALYAGASSPAAPGETIVVYATGFGLPITALTAGSEVQTGVLPSVPVCLIGGLPAPVGYAGIASPGLYQLNITVPSNTTAGDNAISCSYGGATTPAGDLVTVN